MNEHYASLVYHLSADERAKLSRDIEDGFDPDTQLLKLFAERAGTMYSAALHLLSDAIGPTMERRMAEADQLNDAEAWSLGRDMAVICRVTCYDWHLTSTGSPYQAPDPRDAAFRRGYDTAVQGDSSLFSAFECIDRVLIDRAPF